MGNSLGGKRKGAKIMQLDGTVFRVKPPATAGAVLRDHPGFQLLESEEVKLLGVRARPLAPDAPLRPGRRYFLVQLPRPGPPPRRAWSGSLHVGARERLESLMLARRSTSDLSIPAAAASAPSSPLPASSGKTPVQLRMRLPRAQVAKLMEESRDAAEAAAKIMELCASANGSAAVTPDRGPGILRSRTPEWGPGFMMPTPERGTRVKKTPDRWPSLPRTPEYAPPEVKVDRKEKRTRFVALPDEIIA